MSELAERFETHDPGEKLVAEKIRCDACPVMCYIADGRTGACDRYGNSGGRIVRMDPLTILDHAAETGGAVVPFTAEGEEWDGELVNTERRDRNAHRGCHVRMLLETARHARDDWAVTVLRAQPVRRRTLRTRSFAAFTCFTIGHCQRS